MAGDHAVVHHGCMTSVGRQRNRDADPSDHASLERRLLEAVTRGDLLDLTGDGPVDEAAMRSWGADRTISASVIRDLVRGRLVSEPDPHGLRLRGARIAGRVDLENVASDVALDLRDCFLPDGISLQNARLGTVTLAGCRLEQPPGEDAAPIEASLFTAPALVVTRCTATSASAHGTVRLRAARIGTVDCAGTRLRNTVGPALDADGLDVAQSVILRDGFAATSVSALGTVRLLGARIGGQLNCVGARLDNTVGPALNADNISVDRDMFLRNGFTAVSASEQATVRLMRARIGALDCAGARVENAAGPALEADGMQVDRDVVLADGFTAVGAGADAVLTMTGARVNGAFYLDTDEVTRADSERPSLVDLDGLTYAGLPRPMSLRRWLTLLRENTPGYAAQPYQHIAAAYRAAGHDRDARTILIAQRRDQIQRAGLSGLERLWGHVTGITLGYGYQPWRALLLLLATLAAAVVLSVVVGGHHGGLAQKAAPGTATACSTVDQIGAGLDLGAPLIKTGARDRCQPTETTAGRTLTVAGWVLQLLAWTFATLFVAGFTSAVRKT